MVLTDNLSTRITLILLAGSAALLLIIALLAGWPPSAGGPRLSQPTPSQAAAIVEAVEAGGPGARTKVVRGLDASALSVALAAELPPPEPSTRAAGPADPGYGGYARALAGRGFRIDLRTDAPMRWLAPERRATRLSVRLRDGAVLVLERRPARIVRAFVARFALTMAAGALVVLAMLVLAVRQTARPVAGLARAVERFGDRLDAEDLPLRGPREIRALSGAFNAMKRRIRALVDERTRVLAAVAHDMRTYLTRLRLRADFITDEAQRGKAVADLEEMAALLDDTLLFAREDGGRRQAAQPLDVGRELEALAVVRREMGDAVTLDVPAGLLARASPLALRRMAGNLIDNAVRYGGAAEVLARAEPGWVCIAVGDRGPGLPEEALVRVTGPFERMEGSRNRATGGAGLGLAIVGALAEAQGGRLSLRNRPEGGLIAEVRLPILTVR